MGSTSFFFVSSSSPLASLVKDASLATDLSRDLSPLSLEPDLGLSTSPSSLDWVAFMASLSSSRCACCLAASW